MRYVSPSDELRYRLDELDGGLTAEDIVRLGRLDSDEAWPPEISSTRRVDRVLKLLEDARRAEVGQRLASGTTDVLRAHVLVRTGPPRPADRDVDIAMDPAAPANRRFRVILFSADGRLVSGFHGYHTEELPAVGDTIDGRERSNEARVIRAQVTHVTREHNLPIAPQRSACSTLAPNR